MSSNSEVKPTRNPFHQDGMFNGASPVLFEFAKNLRKNMTDAEKLLWYKLKGGINGHKFRRQHPIGIYIADFYCHKLKMVIELDGSIHGLEAVKKQDVHRENDWVAWGYIVLRFSNDDIMKDIESVLLNIQNIIKHKFENIKL